MKNINEAIEFLDAELMDDGDYKYFAEEVRLWYRVSESDLEALVEMSNDQVTRDDAYSHWCASYGEILTAKTSEVLSPSELGCETWEDVDGILNHMDTVVDVRELLDGRSVDYNTDDESEINADWQRALARM